MKQIIFGGGTVVLDIPEEWEVSDRGFFNASIAIPEYPAVRLHLSVNSYEYPEAVLRDDVSYFVFEEGMPFTEDSCVAPETLFVYRFEHGDSDAYVQVYKWAHILPPDHVRVLVARLEMPSIGDARRIMDPLSHRVQEMVEAVRFADRLTPLDRVAPADGLQLIAVEERIFFRAPCHWRPDVTEDGRNYCDTRDAADGTLWIDWDIYRDKRTGTVVSAMEKASEFATIISDMGHWDIAVDGGDDRARLQSVSQGKDSLVVFCTRLFVSDSDRFAVVHFSLVLSVADADTPLARRCRAVVERETGNAVVLLE